MQNKKLGLALQSFAAVAATAVLTACGSSGGGGGAPATPPTITSPGLFADVGIPVPTSPDSDIPTLAATGTGPITWAVTSGTLPAGLSITPEGKLAGSSSTAGQNTVTVDASGPGGKDTESIVVGVRSRLHRISEDINGVGGNGGTGDGIAGAIPRSIDAGISGNGRYVVFDSAATNLIPGFTPTTTNRHIYLKDRWTGLVELISKNTAGDEGNGDSHVAVVSDDGRFVAFDSFASNLVSNDGNGSRDVFVRDRQLNRTTRISQNAQSQGDGLCPNGQGEACNSFDPSMSADGNIIAFGSLATLSPEDIHISPGSALNQLEADIYVFERATGQLRVVSRSLTPSVDPANGRSGSPAVSGDGTAIAFASTAGNLAAGDPETGAGEDDVFVYNVATRIITKVSNVTQTGQTQPNGASQNPTISADGSRIVFSSTATNLINGDPGATRDIFVADRNATTGAYAYNTTAPRLGGTVDSDSPSISRDGTHIVFQSAGTGLPGSPLGLNGQEQIFRWQIGQNPSLVSVNSGGFAGNGTSRFPLISGNGQFISFISGATDLVGGDSGTFDAFVAQR